MAAWNEIMYIEVAHYSAPSLRGVGPKDPFTSWLQTLKDMAAKPVVL